MLAATATRSRSSDAIHAAVEAETLDRLEYYAVHLDRIDSRLRQLDEEWDIERAIQANAATLALAGTTLALLHDRRWALLPLAVSGFLLQHSVQGWCPPVPVLRRMGFRTPAEIERERYSLKALRGDFDGATDAAETFRGAH